MWMLVAGCLVVALLLYRTVADLILVHVYGLPPGPISLPLIGGMYTLNMTYAHLSLMKLSKRYGGVFSFRLGPAGRVVILQDMKHVTQVFEDPDCNDRPPVKIFEILNRGADGIGSCSYGRRWKKMTQTFHKGLAKLSNASLEGRADHAYQQLFDKISTTKLGTEYFPKEDVFYALSALVGSLVYGIEPENLSSKDLEMRIRDHKAVMDHLNPLHPVNVFPPLANFPLPGLKCVQECLDIRDKVMHQCFERHYAGFTGQIHDVMDIIVSYMKSKEGTSAAEQEDIQLPDLILSSWTMYLAGCRTSADTVMWTILYLCCYPGVQQKMQEEIDRATETTSKVLEAKTNLHYTRAVIFEVLRISSILALSPPKYTTKKIKIGKYTIPKGSQIMTNQWAIHHDESHWPNPYVLRPERFLDEDGKLFTYQHIFHKMPFLPFSFGKRPCLGRLLALDLILIMMVGMLRRFNMRFPEGYVPNLQGKFDFHIVTENFPAIFTER